MNEQQNARVIPPNADSSLAESNREEANDVQTERTAPAGKRPPRTRFSWLQRLELERAFNQFHYITPHSCHILQKLGIPKRKIMVWFKNRRIRYRKKMLEESSSGKQLPARAAAAAAADAAAAARYLPQPDLSANQSFILLPIATGYLHSEVQNPCMEGPSSVSSSKNWPYGLTGGIINESLGCSGRLLPSSIFQSLNQSPGSIETPALSYGSSGMSQTIPQLSAAYPNVPWMDSLPDLTASFPALIHQDSQRVPEGNDPGPRQRVQCHGHYSSVPWKEPPNPSRWPEGGQRVPECNDPRPKQWYQSHGHHSTVPWIEPQIHQGGQRVPEGNDPGPKQRDQSHGHYSTFPWTEPQIAETSQLNANMTLQDMEYMSLLDDLLAVLDEDIMATKNNTEVQSTFP
ncbi:Homeodomain [Desmophyllum pertusum]|uniref:Homeodomain n=1 Tax=Desmophyllum pertusum TaxID=174260 RepID=A0A9X0CLY4_9CNID|nr:Homeodomain [Desmophyllum pertusum]